jgi:hypothetical protein
MDEADATVPINRPLLQDCHQMENLLHHPYMQEALANSQEKDLFLN